MARSEQNSLKYQVDDKMRAKKVGLGIVEENKDK